MMGNEMVERVGRAIAEAENYAYDPYPYDVYARAAIEAMREPTEAMAKAGFHANEFRNEHNGEPGCPNIPHNPFPADAFDDEYSKVIAPEKLEQWENGPRCMVARVHLPPIKAYQAMIDAALSTDGEG